MAKEVLMIFKLDESLLNVEYISRGRTDASSISVAKEISTQSAPEVKRLLTFSFSRRDRLLWFVCSGKATAATDPEVEEVCAHFVPEPIADHTTHVEPAVIEGECDKQL